MTPQQQLRMIQGPVRHSWWCAFVTFSLRCYPAAPWLGDLLMTFARLERFTRA